jgi:DNA repair protein RadD
MKLRDYQHWAEDSIFAYFEKKVGNPVVAMPTGTGKGVNLASLSIRIVTTWAGQRILMLVPTKELARQNASKFPAMNPAVPVGICSASLHRYELGRAVTIGTIGTIINRKEDLGWLDLVFIDECHLVSDKDETQYRVLIDYLLGINPNLKTVGFSATPYRLGLGMITQGGLFTDVCFDATTLEAFNWFIDEGYLVPVIPRPTNYRISTEGVKSSGGDFIASDLQRKVNKAEITTAVVSEALELLAGRNHVLWFATGIEHAEAIRDELESRGETAVAVHSKSLTRDRDLDDFQAGRARHCINFGVLTTGFDFPALDAIVMLRSTKSPGLWVQMLGRGTRPFYFAGTNYDLTLKEHRLMAIAMSTKQDCLVLDFAYNTAILGPINDPKLPKKKGVGGGDPPIKTCGRTGMPPVLNIVPGTSNVDKGGGPNGCGCWNHPSMRNCIQCGAEFTFEVKFQPGASSAPLLKASKDAVVMGAYEKPVVEEHKVTRVSYEIHKKEGRPDSIKVFYYCGLRRFTHYVLPEHVGNPRRRSEDWWMRHGGGTLPESTLLARARVDSLRTPRAIKVWIKKEFPQVIDWIFDE